MNSVPTRDATSAPDAISPGAGATLSLRLVVFLAGAVLMGFEILGSRVLAPTHGSSVYVWGSLISTFLIALALGYSLGGRLADRYPSAGMLSIILSLAAVVILPTVEWGGALLESLARSGWDARASALAGTLILFLPSSLAMGMVTPFAVRISIRRMEAAGSVAGGYSALSTAGSILGTLAMTFLLIPSFAVRTLLIGLASALVVCALLLARRKFTGAVAGLAAAGCGLVALAPLAEGVGNERVLLRRDTAYHHIVVTQLFDTRSLRFDNLTQSSMNLTKPDQVEGYQRELLFTFAMRPGARRVCMIGLGAGDVIRAIRRVRPDVEVESVEIDPVVRDIASRFFGYRESDRIRTVIQDGRTFLARGGAPYDVILLDAFNSNGVPFHLTTPEFFRTVIGRLGRDGVFAANFVGSLMGKESRLFWASYATMRRQFGQVYILSDELASGRTTLRGNIVVLATISGDPLDLDLVRRNADALLSAWKPSLSARVSSLLHSPEPPPGTPELTDAYSPVEALQHF